MPNKRKYSGLNVLLLVLLLINTYVIRYTFSPARTKSRIPTRHKDLSKICAVSEIESIDLSDTLYRLSACDFLKIHRTIRREPSSLDHIDQDVALVFNVEQLWRTGDRMRNKNLFYICLERVDSKWRVKVLNKEYTRAHPEKYKIACIKRR